MTVNNDQSHWSVYRAVTDLPHPSILIFWKHQHLDQTESVWIFPHKTINVAAPALPVRYFIISTTVSQKKSHRFTKLKFFFFFLTVTNFPQCRGNLCCSNGVIMWQMWSVINKHAPCDGDPALQSGGGVLAVVAEQTGALWAQRAAVNSPWRA